MNEGSLENAVHRWVSTEIGHVCRESPVSNHIDEIIETDPGNSAGVLIALKAFEAVVRELRDDLDSIKPMLVIPLGSPQRPLLGDIVLDRWSTVQAVTSKQEEPPSLYLTRRDACMLAPRGEEWTKPISRYVLDSRIAEIVCLEVAYRGQEAIVHDWEYSWHVSVVAYPLP